MAKTHPSSALAFRAGQFDGLRPSSKGIPYLPHELGISEQALRGWLKRAEVDAGRVTPGIRLQTPPCRCIAR